MIIGINQPHYLPWKQYYQRISYVDMHVYLDHVQFEKNSLVNRNYVIHPITNIKNLLTVPVRTKGMFGSLFLSKLQIAEGTNWRFKHINTINASLIKHCNSRVVLAKINDTLESTRMDSRLVDLIYSIDNIILSEMDINTPLCRSSDFDLTSTKSELILEICQLLGATTYLSGTMGKSYLDLQAFSDRNIRVEFTDEVFPLTKDSKSLTHRVSAICDL